MSYDHCACGCGASLAGLRSNARYATAACRTRAWKRRTGYADQRRRKPSRNAAARKPDLRISYRRAVDAVATIPELAALPRVRARGRAQDALRDCLPPRLRDAA